MKNVVIIKIRDKNGDVVAVDEIALPGDTADGMTATITTMSRPRRMQRQERSPLHPRALRLSDLRVGMRIRVCSKTLNITKYTAIVASGSFSDDIGYKVPLVVIEQGPLGYEGVGYHEMYAADMGLIKHRASGQWNCSWYTVAAE